MGQLQVDAIGSGDHRGPILGRSGPDDGQVLDGEADRALNRDRAGRFDRLQDGEPALPADPERSDPFQIERRTQTIEAGIQADRPAPGADAVDRLLDGGGAGVMRLGMDADRTVAALAADLGRPEHAAVGLGVREGHHGETRIVVMDAAGRGVGQLLDAAVGHPRGEDPVVAHLEFAAGRQGEVDQYAVLERQLDARGRE